MNLIKCYIDFKRKNIEDISRIFILDLDNTIKKESFDKYLNIYINTYYFHKLETLNNEEIKKYNFNTIVKELEGKKSEILYEYNGSADIKEFKKSIDTVLVAILMAIKLSHIEEITQENIIKELEYFKFNANKSFILKLFSMLNNNYEKENKYIESLDLENFNITYRKYLHKTNKYHVDLNYDIKILSNRYSDSAIKKNYNKEELSINKFTTTLSLLAIDLIKKMKNSEEIGIYFVDLPSLLLNSNSIEEIIESIYHENLSQNISFLVNYNDYLTNKKVLNLLDRRYSFSAYVDMSHINLVEEKLESIENIKLFDYGILDKVKSKDYEIVINYELSGKEIFNSEFEKE